VSGKLLSITSEVMDSGFFKWPRVVGRLTRMALPEIVGRSPDQESEPFKSKRLSLVAKHGAELRRFLSQVMHESASVIVCREKTLNAEFLRSSI
jgi:hypothetical protein